MASRRAAYPAEATRRRRHPTRATRSRDNNAASCDIASPHTATIKSATRDIATVKCTSAELRDGLRPTRRETLQWSWADLRKRLSARYARQSSNIQFGARKLRRCCMAGWERRQGNNVSDAGSAGRLETEVAELRCMGLHRPRRRPCHSQRKGLQHLLLPHGQ